jgi:hypothetical protein
MGCVPRVSELRTCGRKKFQLERDMCHPFDWNTCSLLVFRHVALFLSLVNGALDGHKGHVVPNCAFHRNPVQVGGERTSKGRRAGVHRRHPSAEDMCHHILHFGG